MHFMSKEGYLSWRNNWRKVYSELSNEIREKKKECSNKMRTSAEPAWKEQYKLGVLRTDANALMESRKESKIAAKEHYEHVRSQKLSAGSSV